MSNHLQCQGVLSKPRWDTRVCRCCQRNVGHGRV